MKSKFFFVAAAAIIIFSYVACNLFNSPNNKSELVGKWQIVNVSDSSIDSSKNALGMLMLGLASNGTWEIDFAKDSSFKIQSGTTPVDSGKYVYDESAKQLSFLGSDTTQFNLNRSGDDSLQLISTKDSVYYSLRKIK